MSKWVFDIETDGLLHDCTKMYVLVMKNVTTKEVRVFLEGDESWRKVFDEATYAIGHNILGFDVFALKKLFNYDFPKSCKLIDTLLLSQILNYKRFGSDGHSLERWGFFLSFPKHDFNDFSKYSEEMLEYCIQDVMLTHLIYDALMAEVNALFKKAPNILHYIRAEHAAVKWQSWGYLHGWPFDLEAAHALLKHLQEEMQKAYDALSSKLGIKCVAVDKKKGIVEEKKPKWTKQGCYDSHTANWFGVDPWSGYEGEERIVEGPYCRVEFTPLDLNSINDVKVFLYRNGWEPTDWNYKLDPNTNTKVKTSPKITEDSLEFLGGDGKLYTNFLTARSRHSILETWIQNTDKEGMLHGDCFPIGTPSMRTRHSIIVNVPSVDSPWGKEMRALFKAKPGWKLIGCDSSGNQARGLAYYLGDNEYINILLNGDIHQYNADKLTAVLKGMGIDKVVPRSAAKRVLYAFLFGASGEKLWLYIFGSLDERGKQLKKGFLKSVPGFKSLIDKLTKIYSETKKYSEGYIPGIAGNKIYVDSYHKLLVYLLQACEKATCSAAIMLIMERLEERNIPYIPLIYYHDEADFMVPEEYAEEAAAIGKQAFVDGPKLYGIDIMDGSGKIGDTWYDIH